MDQLPIYPVFRSDTKEIKHVGPYLSMDLSRRKTLDSFSRYTTPSPDRNVLILPSFHLVKRGKNLRSGERETHRRGDQTGGGQSTPPSVTRPMGRAGLLSRREGGRVGLKEGTLVRPWGVTGIVI